MSEDKPREVEKEPPGPQPNDPPPRKDGDEDTVGGSGVDETSDESFPASDSPSW
jgi:hypothetical protein